MISYIQGSIIYKKTNYIIILAGHIGYKIFIVPTEHFPVDTDISLFLHEHISEEKDDLYGFKTADQLDIFEVLISVSGLGPKMAIAVLSSLDKKAIETAIETSDVKVFEKIKGIGKKLASKIILELKGKIDFSQLEKTNNLYVNDTQTEEALISLGFKKPEINKILSSLPKDILTIEDKIRWALKNAK